MFHYIYPAVFFFREDEYHVLIPDLNLTTVGISLEEAYILAKDYLRVYFSYVVKFDLDSESPSPFIDIVEKFGHYEDTVVMLIDAQVEIPKD